MHRAYSLRLKTKAANNEVITLTKAVTHVSLETFLHLKHKLPALQWASHCPHSPLLAATELRETHAVSTATLSLTSDGSWSFYPPGKANTWRVACLFFSVEGRGGRSGCG